MQRIMSSRRGRVFLILLAALLAALSIFTYHYLTPTAKQAEQPLYAGLLPSQTDSLAQVTSDRALQFPDDHQAHPDYAIEWWYFTTNLQSIVEPSRDYALQYTLFRFNQGNKRASAWSDGQMYMAHASLHTPETHFFNERFSHGGFAHVGVGQSPFSIRMDDWLWQANNDQLLPANLSLKLTSKPETGKRSVTVNLDLTTSGPIVLQGDAGFSQKSTLGTHASYYYSHPFIQVNGSITAQVEQQIQSVQVTGQGWFDHEWTSQLLDDQTLGWDWFSIHLDDGSKLMAFRMRLKDSDDFMTGTWIDAKGTPKTLSPGQIALEPMAYEIDKASATEYPTQWSVKIVMDEISNKAVALTIRPQKPAQWNKGRFQYYEGAIIVSGTHAGKGFMELTGY